MDAPSTGEPRSTLTPPARPRVLVILDTREPYTRGMLAGIRRYLRERAWTVALTGPDTHEVQHFLQRWRPDGVIGVVRDQPLIEGLGYRPAVSLYSESRLPPQLRVHSDPVAGGRMVAEHFIERDLVHLRMFVSPRALGARQERAQAFEHAAAQANCSVGRFELTGAGIDQHIQHLATWLRRQPRPMGLMAMDDNLGYLAILACDIAGLRVPEDVAIVGHNNDQPLCEFCDPTLSSVATNQSRIGYEGAALLDRLMRGEPPLPRAGELIRIPPLGIVTRGSSDIQQTDDRAVAAALRYIRDHIGEGIGPRDVIDNTPASASTLQRRFRQHCGQTLGAALQQARLRHVQRLLLADDRPLAEIVCDAGYEHLSQMCREFKRSTGQTPSQYRRQFRAAD